MSKRWSQKAKKQLILDAIAVAVPILRLGNWQIEIEFGPCEYRATCEAQPEYKTMVLTFDLPRIRIFECVEFAVHELCHAITWEVAALLEDAADSESAMQKAVEAYEELTTEMGHIAVPLVVQELERRGKLPIEAKDIPTIIVRPKLHRRKGLDKTGETS